MLAAAHRRRPFGRLDAGILKLAGSMTLPLVAAVSWGGAFPVAKTALPTVNAFYLSTIRYGLGALVLLAVLLAVEGRRSLRFDGHFLRVLLLGSVGFAGFNLLAFIGLAHTRSQNAALIMATMPLLTALVLWAQRGIRPARSTLAFMLVALAGVGLVITRGSLSLLVSGQIGVYDLLILVGAFCWVVYTLGAASIPGWSPLRYTALSAAASMVAFAIASLLASWTGYVRTPSRRISPAWSGRSPISSSPAP